MLSRAVFVLSAVLASSCSDPRCSQQNCKTMIDSCRVEIVGGSTKSCSAWPRPSDYDYAAQCVKACNETGKGQLVECMAKKATECEAAISARRYQDIDAIATTCSSNTRPAPQQSCADTCEATRATCDEGCYPRACDNCVRAGGGACMSSCPESSYVQCQDCSSDCNIAYVHCLDGCPR